MLRALVLGSCALASLFVVASHLPAATEPAVERHDDLVYAEADGQRLLLNLFVPKNVERPPLVVYIHGGSWRAGSYKSCSIEFLTEQGFAVASIEYRFTNVATFPAQIHDCKGAIRWLRANAAKYGYDATKIGVAGSSAGGHLAVLLGTSGDVADLEGTVGGNLDQSSRVAAVVDYYGPTDFVLRGKTHPARANAPESGTYQLLGGAAVEHPEKAKRASGVTYVSADDPPLLIVHGNKDKTVYMDQAESIRDAYAKAKLDAELIVVPDGGHGGKAFYTGDTARRATEFFRRHLSPPAVIVERGVSYLPEGRAEKADLYLPKGRAANVRSPAVVIIHGGGWVGGKRNAGREVNIGTTLAANGYVALSIDYLLATVEKPSWPVNIHDCKTAVRWLRANAERLQIDADHIGAIGGSAGGHLVALLAASSNVSELDPPGPYGEFSSAIQCVVPMYGAAEVRDGAGALQMLGKSREQAPELYLLASPTTHVDPRDPPHLILHGTADKSVPVEQSEILARALAKAGVEHELVIIPDAPHSFHLQPKQRDLRPLVLGFFDKHLKPKQQSVGTARLLVRRVGQALARPTRP